MYGSNVRMRVRCPVCGEEMEWVHFPTHLDDNGDDEHVELFNKLEQERDDAYFSAEYDFSEAFEVEPKIQ